MDIAPFMVTNAVLPESEHSYNSLPLHHEAKVHIVGETDLQPSFALTTLLKLGLKFIPTPPHNKLRVTAHAEEAQANLADDISRIYPHLIPTKNLSNQPCQTLFKTVTTTQEYQQMFKDHYLSVSDKNMGICIVTKTWAIQQCTKQLGDKSSYQQHPNNVSNQTILNFAKQLEEELRNDLLALDVTYAALVTPNSSIPYFYPVPKVHKKKPYPGRPIAGAFNAPTKFLSMALGQILLTIQRHWKNQMWTRMDQHLFTIIQNSDECLQTLERELKMSESFQLHSYDFVSMYPNLNLDYIIESVKEIVEILHLHGQWAEVNIPQDNQPIAYDPSLNEYLHATDNGTKIQINLTDLPCLVELCIRKYPYIQCRWIPNTLWKQIKGVAMGTNCAPPLANLACFLAEWKYFTRSPLGHFPLTMPTNTNRVKDWFPRNFSRYLDDLLVPTPIGVDPLPILRQIYTPTGLDLEPSDKTKTGQTIFLDLVLPTMQTDTLHFGMYTKPGNAYEYHHFQSHAPLSVKKGLVIGAAKRILRRNSEMRNAVIDWHRTVAIFNGRGYSNHYINKTLTTYLLKPRQPKEPKYLPPIRWTTRLDWNPQINAVVNPLPQPTVAEKTPHQYRLIISYTRRFLPQSLRDYLPTVQIVWSSWPSFNNLAQKKLLTSFPRNDELHKFQETQRSTIPRIARLVQADDSDYDSDQDATTEKPITDSAASEKSKTDSAEVEKLLLELAAGEIN